MLGIFVAQLLACGNILSAFGIPFWLGVVVCAGVILIYSSMGGMWSVVVGDTVQVIIMMVGASSCNHSLGGIDQSRCFSI